MASGGPSGRTSSGPRSFDFGSDDVLCSYDDFSNQDLSNGNRSDPSAKDFHESRMGRPLVSIYGQQDDHPKEEIIDAVEKCMKKYADNLLQHLEGISGRLSQLEIYCYKLERSIGEFRADIIHDQSDADTKLKSIEKHLQEVHRSIQILRDKQELAETQKELTKLQLAPKESSNHSQKSDETAAPSSFSEPQRHNDVPEIPDHHLALALPHQIPPQTSLPARAHDQNQLPMQQQQTPQPQAAIASLGTPHDRYTLNQPVPYYPQQRQQLLTEMHYIQPRPQLQDPMQAVPRPPTPQQPQVVSQVQTAQPRPQYQQQWSQPASHQFTQQGVAPTQQPASQAQLARPHTPSTYLSYSHHPANPETFAYATVAQSSGNHPNAVPFGYGSSGSTASIPSQTQQQAGSQTSFALPPANASGYMSTSPYAPQSNIQGYNAVYSVDGSRVQTYQPVSYALPSNIQGMQTHQLPPNSNSVFRQPGTQLMCTHPYADMIEKAASMGFPRDHVAGVVDRMAESGQPVDFNALLDRLNSRPAPAGPPRAWSG